VIGSSCPQARLLCSLLLVGLAAGSPLAAQELEPDAYEVAPIGLNVVTAAYSFSSGDVSFDPALPLEDTDAQIHTLTLGYGRSVNVAGRSGQVGIGLPLVLGHVHARYIGDLYQVDRSGLADPRFRIAINVYGAPAMDLNTFMRRRPRTLVGLSLTGVVPVGQYKSSQLINLGTNRWAFKPEVGLSHGVGRWTLELYGGAWLFTTNTSFFRGGRRDQQPIGALQFHVEYLLRPKVAVALNTNFYTGGRTTVNGRQNLDLQQNSRVGGTLKMPLGHRRMLRAAVSWGAYTTIGAAFTSVSASYLYSWGAGL
jgi:hypothetical protein